MPANTFSTPPSQAEHRCVNASLWEGTSPQCAHAFWPIKKPKNVCEQRNLSKIDKQDLQVGRFLLPFCNRRVVALCFLVGQTRRNRPLDTAKWQFVSTSYKQGAVSAPTLSDGAQAITHEHAFIGLIRGVLFFLLFSCYVWEYVFFFIFLTVSKFISPHQIMHAIAPRHYWARSLVTYPQRRFPSWVLSA